MDNNIYKIIVENLGVEIFVSDGDGNVIFVNPASIEINHLDIQNIIGKNVKTLIDEGYFSESSTLKVLETGKSVSVLQTLKDNKTIIATGIPIHDKNGDIEFVISYSQDIDAVNTLVDTVDKQEEEIATLKRALFKDSDFDVNDPLSLKLKASLEKVASLDIPLLIYGESGTGKQIAARHVHFAGNRKDYPYITVNCSNTDEETLDIDLFGSEEVFEHESTVKIKHGKLDMATEGTIVLSNISHMPEKIQAKLFKYLNTGQFVRRNGSTTISSNARIIGLTGVDLKELIDENSFMKALYYRLNTIPFNIPPLRSRPADIAYLANQYLSIFNDKYKSKKIFSRDALGVLTSHSWPGNFIELKKTVESSYIMSDGPVIKGSTVYDSIHGSAINTEDNFKVHCDDIIPLKEAKRQLEEQLVKRAYAIYGTTHKTAEALGVNQSTVSRILKKY